MNKQEPPVWETDRDHPGDTVSRSVTVFGPNGETETGRYHFPTGDWCWRNGEWPVVRWERVSALDDEACEAVNAHARASGEPKLAPTTGGKSS